MVRVTKTSQFFAQSETFQNSIALWRFQDPRVEKLTKSSQMNMNPPRTYKMGSSCIYLCSSDLWKDSSAIERAKLFGNLTQNANHFLTSMLQIHEELPKYHIYANLYT